MKKLTILIVLGGLCLNFPGQVRAQSPLKIGDRLPHAVLSGLYNYPAETASLTAFRGQLLIIDFWATWCGPCVRMIPVTDSLQKEYAGRVRFLTVTHEKRTVVQNFLKRYEAQNGFRVTVPGIAGDTLLAGWFPHKLLPHYVWVDRGGTVMAITGHEEVTRRNIEGMLSAQQVALQEKADKRVPYDRKRPLLLENNGGVPGDMLAHSLLARYREGLTGGVSFDRLEPGKPRKITAINQCIGNLLATAWGGEQYWFRSNNWVLEVKDTTKLLSLARSAAYRAWLAEHGFSYELIVPAGQARDLFAIMQEDMKRYFPQYEAHVEKRKVNCLALVRTSGTDKLKSAGGATRTDADKIGFHMHNNYLINFTGRLDILFLQDGPPVVDATGYPHTVDLDLEANLSNVTSLNKALARYDLALKEMPWPVDLLVIRDKTPAAP